MLYVLSFVAISGYSSSLCLASPKLAFSDPKFSGGWSISPAPKLLERSAIANGLLGPSRSKQAAGVSLRQAMAIARENTGGRVLSSKSFNSGNQGAQIHQIRLLVDGERVVTVVVDAQGRVRRR